MVQCSSFVGGRFQMFARNSGPKFLVGDLQLNLNLQCLVIKNAEVVLIDNFIKKSAERIFCRIFFYLTLYDFNGSDSKLLDTRIVHPLCLNIVCWKTWTQFRLLFRLLFQYLMKRPWYSFIFNKISNMLWWKIARLWWLIILLQKSAESIFRTIFLKFDIVRFQWIGF